MGRTIVNYTERNYYIIIFYKPPEDEYLQF